uniref:DUF4352 domain-containing protein n=1 Tax=Streptococcus sobrinus TaxID=1310 RepID=UPI00037F4948
ETTVKEVKSDSKQTESAKKEEKKEDKVFKIGETVEVNGLQITLNSVAFVEADEYLAPEKGKVLEVQFTAKNTSKKEKYFGA